MKTLYNALFLLLVSSYCVEARENLSLGSDMKAYDQIFEKIAEKRLGVDASLIDRIENPFIVSRSVDGIDGEGNVSAPQVVFTLEATFDQKAKINGTWYQKNDDVNGFKLAKVDYNRVVLQNEIEKKELFIRTKDDSNFKISYK